MQTVDLLKNFGAMVEELSNTTSNNEKKEIIQESKQIVDLKELVTSILMVSDLSRQRE